MDDTRHRNARTKQTSVGDEICLVLPLPPSINQQYATVNGRRILSRRSRDYKHTVVEEVAQWLNSIGVTGGFVTGYVLNRYEIIKLPADVYYLSHLPVKMELFDFVTVCVSAIIISFLATLYPAWQAAKLNPVEPLRYE